MPIAPLRLAATVVVVRAATAGEFEVLLVRRNDKVAFMAGAYVFPGGRVDDEDLVLAGGDQALAFRVAAARELVEEANVTVDAADPILIAHWITPEIEIRRFDTRFFLVRMPDGQEARHDESETTDLVWLSPADAIDRCVNREIMLPPPTWTTVKRMMRYRTLEELFDWAGRLKLIPAVQPGFFKDDQGRPVLTLPGDASFPTIEGWEVPEETRFVLQDGRWLPVRQ
jgi:8-oxo-dGTP pyrophosphatase MutT (NUDIX family)